MWFSWLWVVLGGQDSSYKTERSRGVWFPHIDPPNCHLKVWYLGWDIHVATMVAMFLALPGFYCQRWCMSLFVSAAFSWRWSSTANKHLHSSEITGECLSLFFISVVAVINECSGSRSYITWFLWRLSLKVDMHTPLQKCCDLKRVLDHQGPKLRGEWRQCGGGWAIQAPF